MGAANRMLALALSVSLASGCSFLGTRVPENRPPEERLDCLSSLVVAVTDTIPAVAGLFLAGYAFHSASNLECGASVDCNGTDFARSYIDAFGTLALLIGATYATSAAYGYSAHARCRRLNADAPSITGADRRRALVEQWNRGGSTIRLGTTGYDATLLIVESPGCDHRSLASLAAANHWREAGFKRVTCSYDMTSEELR